MKQVRGARAVAAFLLPLALVGCSAVVGVPSPPLTINPEGGCGDVRTVAPEELESFAGCDLEGFTVRVGEVGGAVVPVAGEGVASTALGADGVSWEFSLTNFGEDGVVLELRSEHATEVWGPSAARERLTAASGT